MPDESDNDLRFCGFLHHRAERVVPNVNLNEDA